MDTFLKSYYKILTCMISESIYELQFMQTLSCFGFLANEKQKEYSFFFTALNDLIFVDFLDTRNTTKAEGLPNSLKKKFTNSFFDNTKTLLLLLAFGVLSLVILIIISKCMNRNKEEVKFLASKRDKDKNRKNPLKRVETIKGDEKELSIAIPKFKKCSVDSLYCYFWCNFFIRTYQITMTKTIIVCCVVIIHSDLETAETFEIFFAWVFMIGWVFLFPVALLIYLRRQQYSLMSPDMLVQFGALYANYRGISKDVYALLMQAKFSLFPLICGLLFFFPKWQLIFLVILFLFNVIFITFYMPFSKVSKVFTEAISEGFLIIITLVFLIIEYVPDWRSNIIPTYLILVLLGVLFILRTYRITYDFIFRIKNLCYIVEPISYGVSRQLNELIVAVALEVSQNPKEKKRKKQKEEKEKEKEKEEEDYEKEKEKEREREIEREINKSLPHEKKSREENENEEDEFEETFEKEKMKKNYTFEEEENNMDATVATNRKLIDDKEVGDEVKKGENQAMINFNDASASHRDEENNIFIKKTKSSVGHAEGTNPEGISLAGAHQIETPSLNKSRKGTESSGKPSEHEENVNEDEDESENRSNAEESIKIKNTNSEIRSQASIDKSKINSKPNVSETNSNNTKKRKRIFQIKPNKSQASSHMDDVSNQIEEEENEDEDEDEDEDKDKDNNHSQTPTDNNSVVPSLNKKLTVDGGELSQVKATKSNQSNITGKKITFNRNRLSKDNCFVTKSSYSGVSSVSEISCICTGEECDPKCPECMGYHTSCQ